MTFCNGMSGLKRSSCIRRAARSLRWPTNWMARVRACAAGACSSARERIAPTRSRRRAAWTSRNSSVALVEDTRTRMIPAMTRGLSMSNTLKRIHPGVFQAEVAEPGREGWACTCRTVLADDRAGGILSAIFELDDLIHGDDLALHPADVGDLRDAP